MHRAKTIGLLAWFYLVPCQGQTKPEIQEVEVFRSVARDSQETKFRLVVTGKNLMRKGAKPQVRLKPPPQEIKTEDEAATSIVVLFKALESYSPESIEIVVAGEASEPFNLKPPPPRSIHNVRVLKSNPEKGTVKFRLEVTGQSLYDEDSEKKPSKEETEEKKGPSAKVSPAEGLKNDPTLKGSPAPDFLAFEFEAEDGYRPQTFTLTIDEKSLPPFLFKDDEVPPDDFEPEVYRSIMDPKNVSDIFGRRIAKRFIALQITIVNKSRDYQYIIQDVSLNLQKLLRVGRAELSARELSLLRGVAEKGQQFSPRNLTLRILRGLGNVAGGLVGLQVFGNDFPEATALFNGPTITAFTKIFPDFSTAQLIRLDDATYVANTVIPPQQSKVIVAFLPQRILLDESQRHLFWKDPTKLFGRGQGDRKLECGYASESQPTQALCDLRAIEIYVDGSLVEEVGEIPPFPTIAAINSLEEGKFQNEEPEVGGSIRGRFLKGASLSIDEGASTAKNVTVSVKGSADEDRIEFILKANAPIPPGRTIVLRLEKQDGGRSVALPVVYDPKPPTLDSVEGDLKVGQTKEIILKGSMFVPEITKLLIIPSNIIDIEDVRVTANEIKANLTVPADADSETEYEIKVVILGTKESATKKIKVVE